MKLLKRIHHRLPVALFASGALLTASMGTLVGAEAAENWAKHCASCHGKDGKGETKAGRKAGARDQTDPKYHAERTDARLLEGIRDGVKEDGKEKMKAFKDKLSEDEMKALVAYVRAFKK